MSRPSSAVPRANRVSPPGIQAGGSLLSTTVPARGGYGASSGAAAPHMMTRVSTARASSTTRFARKLLQTRDRGRGDSPRSTRGPATNRAASGASDARIEVAIGQVHEEVNEDECNCQHGYAADDHREVLLANRAYHQAADTRPGEDCFGNDG